MWTSSLPLWIGCQRLPCRWLCIGKQQMQISPFVEKLQSNKDLCQTVSVGYHQGTMQGGASWQNWWQVNVKKSLKVFKFKFAQSVNKETALSLSLKVVKCPKWFQSPERCLKDPQLDQTKGWPKSQSLGCLHNRIKSMWASCWDELHKLIFLQCSAH